MDDLNLPRGGANIKSKGGNGDGGIVSHIKNPSREGIIADIKEKCYGWAACNGPQNHASPRPDKRDDNVLHKSTGRGGHFCKKKH